ncbi:endo-1,4-beta-xylanase [Hirschia baltica]|uniref:Beta-xylanase n=1 Tax=Hirschia baltica (strain ATCC 49814 / DSM 5838 / IFAM 1418) TaxID=582402 RepID=C6XQH5_HIRBI|nr:endo-1,4-beta-xylanase [Hirschia baltica]ACT60474.1 Endo-1,4-beta-xylanase [Hirschia baltica ATCC 49814]
MKFHLVTASILSLFLVACSEKSPSVTTDARPLEQAQTSLKDAYIDAFLIGAALNEDQIYERDSEVDDIITSQFNSIVAENCMKAENIHPEEDDFFWEEADAFIAFGLKNEMSIIGHTLAWHSQTPDWLFVDENGEDVSRDVLLERMQNHITTIMQRYKGKVKGWDVVNEAILDDGSMRESKFYEIIGPDWVEKMFIFANQADPDAELYYNDYSMAIPEKREGAYALVKGMQDKGIRVDGIGMQGHINLDGPTLEAFEESLLRFAELGQVMITELDVTVLPWPGTEVGAEVSMSVEFQDEFNPYRNGLTPAVEAHLHKRYVEMFSLFHKHADKIDRVTLWGVTDANSWRNDWPMDGRTDYPLLFDRANKPKPFVQEIITITN